MTEQFFGLGADRHLSLLAQCHQHFFPTTTKRKNYGWKSKSKRERLNKNGGGGVDCDGLSTDRGSNADAYNARAYTDTITRQAPLPAKPS